MKAVYDHKGYLNPYFGGILLGLLLLLTFYVTGRGLGASGAIKSTVVATTELVDVAHAKNSEYLSRFIDEENGTLNTWLIFQVLGVLVGAFITGTLGHRLKFIVEKTPQITSKTRLILALIGGILFGVGSQFGRGCTSGAALSGSAALGTSGFLAMMMIFGTAYLFAYLVRKLWI